MIKESWYLSEIMINVYNKGHCIENIVSWSSKMTHFKNKRLMFLIKYEVHTLFDKIHFNDE